MSYKRSVLLACVIAGIALSTAPVKVCAQSVNLAIVGANNLPTCNVSIPSGIVFLNVKVIAAAGPVCAISFRIESDCPALITSTTYNLNPPCVTSGSIATIIVVNAGLPITCHVRILPLVGEARIVAADNEGYPMIAEAQCEPFNYVAPYRPYPPDGATNVPVNVKLSFVGTANQVGLGPADSGAFPAICYEGPYPPAEGLSNCGLPIDPGVLLPNTTYKWVAYNHCYPCLPDAAGAVSQVFTFTTGAPVATEGATWGHVKAMYRN